MANSPYLGKEIDQWLSITNTIIYNHPLKVDELLQFVIAAWEGVWSTQIGNDGARVSLREIHPPATVVGYFFEKLLAKSLANKYPKQWASGDTGKEKDLHFISNPELSVEVKSSGQLGLKIFGNRSYGQEIENTDRAKKDKAGYYITVNFYGERLTLVRFGWIDGSDWEAQKSPTGQMAGLGQNVYNYKLIPIKGDYTLDAPVDLLNGVGGKTAEILHQHGIMSIRDVLNNPDKFTGKFSKIRESAIAYNKAFGN
jgi:hypothetical protein